MSQLSIDNEELEIRTSQQQFEDQIDEWHDTIGDLKQRER